MDKKDYLKVFEHLLYSGCKNFCDFKYNTHRFETVEKTDSIEMAKRLCGYYILKTTLLDMEDKEIVEIKPIFRWKDRRVRTHIFLCILAQTIVNKIKDRLTQIGWLKEGKTFFLLS